MRPRRRVVEALMVAATACAAVLPPAFAQATVTLAVSDSTRISAIPGQRIRLPLLVLPSGIQVSGIISTLNLAGTRLRFDSLTRGPFGVLQSSAPPSGGLVTLDVQHGSGQSSRDTVANAWFTVDATPAAPLSTARMGTALVSLDLRAATDQSNASIVDKGKTRAVSVCVVSGVYGDANADGAVNVIDAQQLARRSVGLSTLNDSALVQRGDVTGDGQLNIIDAQQIARYSVALPTVSTRFNRPANPSPVVSSISLTSQSDTLVAAGFAFGLAPEARNTNGVVIDRTWTWQSTDPSILSVDSRGNVVTSVVGTASVVASTDCLSAAIRLRFVNVDVEKAQQMNLDAYLAKLVNALGSSTRSRVTPMLTDLFALTSSGSVTASLRGLDALRIEVSTNSDLTEKALIATILLYAERTRGLISL